MLQLPENVELRRQRFVPVKQFGAVRADDLARKDIRWLTALAEPGMAPQYDEIVALMQELGELRVRLVVLIGKGIFAVPVHPATADVAGHKRPRLMALKQSIGTLLQRVQREVSWFCFVTVRYIWRRN